ncbi:tetratricopeptide repeat protein [Prolixibacteraceae bacterium JC049]|nr:tetratricopeptide repeat protein [Prolixibacteraceae bacterium JC049]
MRSLLYILTCCLFFLSASSLANEKKDRIKYWQNKIPNYYYQADSFRFWMNHMKEDVKQNNDLSLKAKWYNYWGNYYRYNRRPDFAIEGYTKAISISKQLNDQKTLSYSFFNMGRVHQTYLSSDSAVVWYKRALEIDKTLNDSLGISIDYTSLGSVYYSLGQLKEATACYINALQIKEALKDSIGIAIVLNNLGIVFENIDSFDKAYSYYNKAEAIFKRYNKHIQRAKALNNMGTMALRLKEYDKAFNLLNQSLILKEAQKDTFSLVSTYRNLGLIHQHKKEFSEAYNCFKKSLELSIIAENASGQANALLSIGQNYSYLDKKDSALYYYQKAEAKSTQLSDFHFDYSLSQAMVSVHSHFNNFEQALEYSLWSRVLLDSLHNVDKINKITRMEMNYQFDQYKAKQELILEKNNLHIKQQRLTIAFIIVALLTALTLLILLYRNNQFKKKNIKQLQEANDKISAIFQNSMIGFAWVDNERIIRRVNPYIEEISGYSKEELIGSGIQKFYSSEEEYVAYGQLMQKSLQDKGSFEFENQLKRKNGSLAWIKASGKLINHENESLGIIWAMEDITQKKKNEVYLKLFKQLADTSRQGIGIATLQGEIVYANPYLAKITPIETGDRANKIWNSYPAHLHSKLKNEIIPHALKEGQWTGELEQIIRDGSTIHTIENIFVIKDKHGTPLYLADIITDITNKQNIEKQLRQSNETQNLMLSVISHDIRGPIGSIHQLAAILDSNIDNLDQHELNDFIHQVKEHTGKAYNLLEDMLLWAKNQTGALQFTPTSVQISSLIKDSISLYEELLTQKKIIIQESLSFNDSLKADKDMLHSVIRNLLSNAIKFSPQHSTIEIHTENIENSLHVKVVDHGVGIDSNTLDKLQSYSSNYTTRGTHNEKGYGLGLKLCQKFVEAHNGKLTITSQVNKGTTIEFFIPIS